MAENADGEVRIATTLDTQDLQKQLDQLKGKLDKTGKDIEKKATPFKKMGDFIKSGGAAAAIGGTAAALAIKKTTDALNECAAAYRVQENAEKALAIAARNNPYLNEENVYNLRNFASELQNISEVGDEVSLQIMAELAATGRTESEIINIMSAAADMAAATNQDIGSVAQQLNATFNGNAGALGRQIGAIKDLTEEELAAGKAIEIVAKQYKGSAAELANVEVQLSNAWGDFKENIGSGWQAVTEPVKSFFLGILNDINEAAASAKALRDANAARDDGNANVSQTKLLLDEAEKELELRAERATRANKILMMTNKELQKTDEYLEFITWSASANPVKDFKNQQNDIITAYKTQREEVKKLREEYNGLSAAEKAAADESARLASEEEKAQAKAARDAEATKYINENRKALEEQIKAIQLKADVTGQEIDAGELYNAYLNSYIELITKSNGLVSENNSAAKERLKLIEDQAIALKEQNNEIEKVNKLEAEREEYLRNAEKIRDTALALLKDEAAERLQLIKEINANELLSEKEKHEAIAKLEEEAAQRRREGYAERVNEIIGYVQQIQQIASDAAAIMLNSIQTENEAELDALNERYEKGEMSEEEYYDKRKELKRKAAQEEYKIKMFEWSASILAATANIAEGVTKAIAQGGAAGLVTGALVGAAGAVQIASIIASKPVPPSYYTGGVIGGMNGATYGSDNTYIHARTGEMVLNAHQQRGLWDMLNGQTGRQQAGLNLTVNNTQANNIDANVSQNNGEIVIDILDKHINKGLSDGTYDLGIAGMNVRQEGVSIL